MDRHTLNKRRIRARNGSTLVEVLVGGLLVALFVVAVFQVIVGGTWLNNQQLRASRSFQELERVLEKPQYSSDHTAYTALSYGSQPDTTVALNTYGDTSSANNLTGTISTHVDSCSFTSSGITFPAKKITATISYTYNGVAYSDSLQTFLTYADNN